MARQIATKNVVDFEQLHSFVQQRDQWMLVTLRRDGRPQISPVTGAISDSGQMLVSTYPFRDKVHNLRRDPRVSVCVLSDHFGGAWVQIDGTATISDMPEALDGLIEYYRSVSGEHPDWDEYRQAMFRQDKTLIKIDPQRWGPIATGGFPAMVATKLDSYDNDRSSNDD